MSWLAIDGKTSVTSKQGNLQIYSLTIDLGTVGALFFGMNATTKEQAQRAADKMAKVFSDAVNETVTASVGFPIDGINITYKFETNEGRDHVLRLRGVFKLPLPTVQRDCQLRWKLVA